MRLHFSFIVDALKTAYDMKRQTYGPSSDYELRLSHPRIYRPESTPTNVGLGDLLLARADDLPCDAKQLEGCSIVCIGSPDDSYSRGICDCVELAAETPLYGVLELIIDTFDRFEYWFERVTATLICSDDLSELFSLYLELLENPVFLTNSVHEIVVYVENPDTVSIPDIYHFNSKDSSEANTRENLMQNVLVSPYYEQSFRTIGPQLWVDDVFPFDSLYCNIVVDGVFRARLLVDEQVRPFRISDYALLQMLHDDVFSLMCRQPLLIDDFHVAIWKHLADIIGGAAPDEGKLSQAKSSAGWDGYERFVCLAVKLNERDRTISSSHVNCALIEQTVPRCRAFVYEDSIVTIIPLEPGEEARDIPSQDLLLTLRDRLIKTGVSNSFSDLRDIRTAYQQASLALISGEQLGRTDWVLHCDDYFLPFMLEHCNADIAYQTLCHSKLRRLIRYDEEKNVEYVKTLKSFVENNCSQVETCRAMYVHRSTLLQRLKRIEEITRFDLGDKEVRLYLLMYFALIEQKEPGLIAGNGAG